MVTKVIYRKIGDEVVALLPNERANFGYIVCYVHIGQHSEADSFISSEGRLATEQEYKNLHKELIRQGYTDLKIVKRVTYKDLCIAWGKI